MHERTIIRTSHGDVTGIAPLVISASRATDIPAFYSEWFINRLNQGYCAWVNPFNRNQKTFISFSHCKVIVFWSKNPEPLIPYLDDISAKGVEFYFQYTVNDYEKEGLEPNIPRLDSRIQTFIRLSEKIGKDRVIWRYDPIVRIASLSLDEILSRINSIGEAISSYTTKLVFSFVDIRGYSKVKNNLKKHDTQVDELDKKDRLYFAKNLAALSSVWKSKIEIATCAEVDDLSSFGISHNRCIDDILICRICRGDEEIMKKYGKSPAQLPLLGSGILKDKKLKDRGQREECCCVQSKDIGAYNTCPHLCTYCYANHSQDIVKNNFKRISVDRESLLV